MNKSERPGVLLWTERAAAPPGAYDMLLFEQDLRRILAEIEAARLENGRGYCLRFHLEHTAEGAVFFQSTVEPLTLEMLRELREKGELLS